MCGMPSSVRGFCDIGKRHKIEVEDEVTAYLRYRNGATGVFVTSTGEAPGTDRLEIAGDKGIIVCERGRISFTRNKTPAAKFLKTSKQSFATPATETTEIKVNGNGGQHKEILRNFVRAIAHGDELIAPAREGIHSVVLANAMLYSSMTGKPVDLPLSGTAYERMLKQLVRKSKFVKSIERKKKDEDFASSF
jgi:predicted dehydrogenase